MCVYVCVLQAELGQLGVGGAEKEREESSVWEDELQQELEGLDLQVTQLQPCDSNFNPSVTMQGVSGEGEGGGGEEVDPETWEAELQEMLDMHSQEP